MKKPDIVVFHCYFGIKKILAKNMIVYHEGVKNIEKKN
jgi:hypothetical protein